MIVRKTLADCKITPKQKRELAKLAVRPDSEIDFSDIPELTDKFWRNAVRNPFYRPVKKQITLRLDADVIALAPPAGQRLSDESQRLASRDHGERSDPKKAG